MKLKHGLIALIASFAVCVFLSSTCDILNGDENKNNTTYSNINNLGNIKEHITGSNSVNFAYARNIWEQWMENRVLFRNFPVL